MQISLHRCLRCVEAVLINGSDARHRMKEKDCGLTRHDSAHGPVGVKIDGRILVSNWCQNAPIWPVFPAHPTFKYIAVNNLQFRQFHGMEEVVGSIPTRSTNPFNNIRILQNFLKVHKGPIREGLSFRPHASLQHPRHLRLRLPLGWSERLRIDLKRHLDCCVPQQLLHHLDVLAIRFQQG